MLLTSLLSRRRAKNLAIIGKDYRMSTSKLRILPAESSTFRTATTSTFVRPVNVWTCCSIRLLSASLPTTSGLKTRVETTGLGCPDLRARSPLENQLFGVKKNEDQNDHTEKVPLPGITRVVPEEDLLKCGEKASHDLKLASKQPREPRLEGRGQF